MRMATEPTQLFALSICAVTCTDSGLLACSWRSGRCPIPVLAQEAALQESARQTPDYAEGFRAFQERRKPNFG
jgi:hypothetical protein